MLNTFSLFVKTDGSFAALVEIARARAGGDSDLRLIYRVASQSQAGQSGIHVMDGGRGTEPADPPCTLISWLGLG